MHSSLCFDDQFWCLSRSELDQKASVGHRKLAAYLFLVLWQRPRVFDVSDGVAACEEARRREHVDAIDAALWRRGLRPVELAEAAVGARIARIAVAFRIARLAELTAGRRECIQPRTQHPININRQAFEIGETFTQGKFSGDSHFRAVLVVGREEFHKAAVHAEFVEDSGGALVRL